MTKHTLALIGIYRFLHMRSCSLFYKCKNRASFALRDFP